MHVIFEEENKLLATKPNTTVELKDCIRNEVDAKPLSMLRRVMENDVATRLQTCVEVEREDVTFNE